MTTLTAPPTRPQPRLAVPRYAWLAVLGLGGGLFLADERTLVDTGNPNLVPSAILLGAVVVPLAFLVYIYGRRLAYDVPTGAVWTTAFVSGLVGTLVAGLLEFHTLHSLGFLPMVAVGLIEEAAKLVVPLAVLLWLRYKRPPDGLLFGVASGAGFAALETMGYAFVALINSRGSLPAVTNLLLLRGVLSPAGHMAWTGISGAALWRAACEGWTGRSLLRFAAVFAVVVALHACWDGIGTLPGYVVIALASLLLLGWTVHRLGPRHAAPAAVEPGLS